MLILTFIIGFSAGCETLDERVRPNIIFIVADDADVGCYGQELIKTANICQLANEGTRFTQCSAGPLSVRHIAAY